MELNKIYQGDCLEVMKTFPDGCIDMVMTSPPYWALRDYGVKGQLGLEPTFQEYINKLCDIFDEVKRVLKKEGTCWVNLGDTYAGSGDNIKKPEYKENAKECDAGAPKDNIKHLVPSKCLCQIPSRFAIEMTNRGWILRNEIIWYKKNCMPSSVKDRFTVDFEKIFFFVKSKKYWFEQQFEENLSIGKTGWEKSGRGNGSETAMRGDGKMFSEQGRNKRCVWQVNPKPFSEAHFAVYPEELCLTPIKAGCLKNGIVLDPFFGAGTTAVVAKKLNRNYIGIELNPEYIKIAEGRLKEIQDNKLF